MPLNQATDFSYPGSHCRCSEVPRKIDYSSSWRSPYNRQMEASARLVLKHHKSEAFVQMEKWTSQFEKIMYKNCCVPSLCLLWCYESHFDYQRVTFQKVNLRATQTGVHLVWCTGKGSHLSCPHVCEPHCPNLGTLYTNRQCAPTHNKKQKLNSFWIVEHSSHSFLEHCFSRFFPHDKATESRDVPKLFKVMAARHEKLFEGQWTHPLLWIADVWTWSLAHSWFTLLIWNQQSPSEHLKITFTVVDSR